MASSLLHSTLLFSLLLISSAFAQTSFRPKALILPVQKDPSTLQYLTNLNQRTPLVPVNLTLDLGGQFLWVNCEQGYSSSSYRPARCGSAQCSLAGSKSCTTECYSAPKPGCYNNTCGLLPDNTVTHTSTGGDLGSDIVTVESTDGKNPGKVVSVPHFLFVCGSTSLLEGLASGVKGMAGLGRTKISLPSQFSTAFSFHKKFAICLSSSTRSNGVAIFGDGPYMFLPNIDASTSLVYTPLIRNPVSTASASFSGDASSDYFIGVKSIKIGEKNVPINTTLLTIDSEGNGGTKISTVNPYTVLETSIYKAVTKFFINELSGVPRVASVAPFEACFNSKNISSTRVGPGVPAIFLVLQSETVFWSIYGANSMVQVSDDVLCLGFVDGGAKPRTSIVIGGYQLEDNLLQFDLAASRLGEKDIGQEGDIPKKTGRGEYYNESDLQNNVMQPPFPLENTPIPAAKNDAQKGGFHMPRFQIYDDKSDPNFHVRFILELNGTIYWERTVALQSVPLILWRNRIRLVSQVVERNCEKIGEDESLRAYAKRYYEVFNRIPGCNQELAVDREICKSRRRHASDKGVKTGEEKRLAEAKLRNQPYYRAPEKIPGEFIRRSLRKHCAYHIEDVYLTQGCRALKTYLEDLVQQKRPRADEYRGPMVSFTEGDLDVVQHPHYDALVISLKIEECQSNGRLQWNADMAPRSNKLEIQADTKKVSTKFTVIDTPSPYNVILGRPWLHTMRVVPSTLHQLLRFLTKHGIEEVRGDQV
ncbi:hypothetical protein HYC85_012898 [Camellia sinensis]|uniref:Peptidase A1 domain-containing protein n=1 Tax=Camellia sinensis TaxID=4442 RepID=A0A7J7HE35_CAMSI|nr:hypothetical protein HYC85_012898 [Camellia sinensis]